MAATCKDFQPHGRPLYDFIIFWHTATEVMKMAKKKHDGRAPKAPAVSDPPVPNRAWTEMGIKDPAPKEKREDPHTQDTLKDPE